MSKPLERQTRQRSAIHSAFAAADRPLLPAEVLDLTQAEVPSLGIATVYRTIKAMLEEGLLTAVQLPGENDRYELAGKHHHHHFKCRQCGRVFETEGCSASLQALAPVGFEVDGHELTLYGRCTDCL